MSYLVVFLFTPTHTHRGEKAYTYASAMFFSPFGEPKLPSGCGSAPATPSAVAVVRLDLHRIQARLLDLRAEGVPQLAVGLAPVLDVVALAEERHVGLSALPGVGVDEQAVRAGRDLLVQARQEVEAGGPRDLDAVQHQPGVLHLPVGDGQGADHLAIVLGVGRPLLIVGEPHGQARPRPIHSLLRRLEGDERLVAGDHDGDEKPSEASDGAGVRVRRREGHAISPEFGCHGLSGTSL